jgi:DNA polymerase-3 subunit delta
MKLEPRRVEAFLDDPGGVRVVLLYGDDTGLITERASRLMQAAAGNAADPFRVVEIGRDAAGRIGVELASLPLNGGRRVVRVREVSDALLADVEAALGQDMPGLLILEGPGLPARSRLRALVERAVSGAAIGCYGLDATGVGRAIRQILAQDDITAEPEAVAWLEGRLGGDFSAIRAELGKLVLYVGRGSSADLSAVTACIGDAAAMSVEDALFAAMVGGTAHADRALAHALAEGATPVGILRAALVHVQRLLRTRVAVDVGTEVTDAVKALRPPLFFRREMDFTAALRLWPSALLGAAAMALWRDEAACKRTGIPAEVVCRHTIMSLAWRAAAIRRR